MEVGTIVMVSIDDVMYATVIDEDGKQRFPRKRITQLLIDTSPIDYNQLWTMCDAGMITREELMDFYRDIGYSLNGFAELFSKCEIINPMWDAEE